MILAQRILDCLRVNGPVSSAEFPNWFRDTDRIDFDSTLTRLMRQNSVSLTLGRYDLVEQKPNGQHTPFVSQAIGASPNFPPDASTVRAVQTDVPITRERFECNTCHKPRFDAEFRRSKLGNRYCICKYCHAQKMAAGAADKLRRPEGECPQAPLPAHGTTSKPVVIEPQGNAGESLPSNLAGGRATLTAEDSLSEPGESSGLDRLPPSDTPPPPQPGSPEPPATSSEHSSRPLAHGTRIPSVAFENPEALSPVGAGRANASICEFRFCEKCGAFVEHAPKASRAEAAGPSNTSPETTNAPPVAALPVVAIQLDPLEAALLHKRAWLVSKRDVLRLAYEARAQPLDEWIQEIDRVMARVKMLLGEGA